MKIVNESIFTGAIRSFFVALFAMVGILVGLILIMVIIDLVFQASKKDSYPSDMKIQTDANGHRKYLGDSVPVILQIDIDGEIGTASLDANKIRDILLESREKSLKDNRVKAVLLVINSPGGGVNDSDMIYRMLLDYKKNHSLPLYVYVDGICASGGYYIACAADRILCSDVSLIGSVGVLSWPPFFNVVDVMKKNWGRLRNPNGWKKKR